MYKFTTTIFLLFFLVIAFAQEEIDNQDVYKPRAFEVGLDFQTLVRNPDLSPLSANILFKSRLKKESFLKSGAVPYLRIHVGMFYQSPKATDNGFETSESKGYNFLVGFEWRQQRRRWQLFSGIDTGVELLKDNVEQRNGTKEISTIGVPLTVFIGLKFFIIPQLSIGIESGPTAIFQWQNTDDMIINSTTSIASQPSTTRASNIYMTFMRYLSINYHF